MSESDSDIIDIQSFESSNIYISHEVKNIINEWNINIEQNDMSLTPIVSEGESYNIRDSMIPNSMIMQNLNDTKNIIELWNPPSNNIIDIPVFISSGHRVTLPDPDLTSLESCNVQLLPENNVVQNYISFEFPNSESPLSRSTSSDENKVLFDDYIQFDLNNDGIEELDIIGQEILKNRLEIIKNKRKKVKGIKHLYYDVLSSILLKVCDGTGKCLIPSWKNINRYIHNPSITCMFECVISKCPNYQVCGRICQEFIFNENSDICNDCKKIAKKSRQKKYLIELLSERECHICFDISIHVKMPQCRHSLCIDCFRKLWYKSIYFDIENEPKFPYPDLYDKYCQDSDYANELQKKDMGISHYQQEWNTWDNSRWNSFSEASMYLERCPMCRI